MDVRRGLSAGFEVRNVSSALPAETLSLDCRNSSLFSLADTRAYTTPSTQSHTDRLYAYMYLHTYRERAAYRYTRRKIYRQRHTSRGSYVRVKLVGDTSACTQTRCLSMFVVLGQTGIPRHTFRAETNICMH